MRRSFKGLVAVEDFSAGWWLYLFFQSRIKNSWKSMTKHGNGRAQHGNGSFGWADTCNCEGREDQSLVFDLEGALLRSSNLFPYFYLVCFEAGSVVRALVLLFMYPTVWLSGHLVSESAAIQMMIFITVAGLKESAIAGVSRAVLSKFYLEDMHPHAYDILVACGKRYAVTALPRLMAESFVKDYLNVEHVLGTELGVNGNGYCTGFASGIGVLVAKKKESAFKDYFRDRTPDVGLAKRQSDSPFISHCKEAYVVNFGANIAPVPPERYFKPLIFHDGRFAVRPTPLMALAIVLYVPAGVILAVVRAIVALMNAHCIPVGVFVEALLGVRVRVKGVPPPPVEQCKGKLGVLFVCTHRTLLDPLFVSVGVNRRVTAVTYSLSRVSEILAPIKTVRLTRCRPQDARAIRSLLEQGDLAICPEGTTCREPYLLRFSSLFAELADNIVPVALRCRIQIFHGSTARGWKALDPFFFLMNPAPSYDVEFLPQLPPEKSCSAGKSSFEVANYIQRQLADRLGYTCTNLTRKDKYRILAGNDGIVNETNVQPKRLLCW